MSRTKSSYRHLAGRFLGSFGHQEPPADDLADFVALLTADERRELMAMSAADRRHAVACARSAELLLGPRATKELIVASGLHDVGKTAADLGTLGRVGATLVGRFLPAGRRADWPLREGWRRRFGLYLEHDVRGAELLAALGSAPEVVAWAREHHLTDTEWTLPAELATCLARADRESPDDL